MESKIQVRYK